MNPSADVLALSSTEIDISAIQPGQAIKTSWRKQPVFVRNLVPAEIEAAKKVPLSDLRDPQTIDERTKPGKENWLITLGVCTHRSEEHTSELQSLMRISYAVFCLKKKKKNSKDEQDIKQIK